MILPITKDYRIKTDEYQWIIQRLAGTRKNRQTGQPEPNWKDVTYWPTLEGAVNGLAQRMLRQCAAETLAEVLEENARILALLCTALDPTYKVTQAPTPENKAHEARYAA